MIIVVFDLNEAFLNSILSVVDSPNLIPAKFNKNVKIGRPPN